MPCLPKPRQESYPVQPVAIALICAQADCTLFYDGSGNCQSSNSEMQQAYKHQYPAQSCKRICIVIRKTDLFVTLPVTFDAILVYAIVWQTVHIVLPVDIAKQDGCVRDQHC